MAMLNALSGNVIGVTGQDVIRTLGCAFVGGLIVLELISLIDKI
jgi:hypothetical protein